MPGEPGELVDPDKLEALDRVELAAFGLEPAQSGVVMTVVRGLRGMMVVRVHCDDGSIAFLDEINVARCRWATRG